MYIPNILPPLGEVSAYPGFPRTMTTRSFLMKFPSFPTVSIWTRSPRAARKLYQMQKVIEHQSNPVAIFVIYMEQSHIEGFELGLWWRILNHIIRKASKCYIMAWLTYNTVRVKLCKINVSLFQFWFRFTTRERNYTTKKKG